MAGRKRKKPGNLPLSRDPVESAQRAGLFYVSDEEPGIRRRRCGRGFLYVDPDGNRVVDSEEKARIQSLVIPPAWQNVWICPHAEGHLQATGRDDKGRKQYLYHPEWERVRNETKFTRLILFGKALPQIRARCAYDLRLRGLPREKVLATVTSLLDRTLIRIGNREYARANKSFGLTTMRDRHVSFTGQKCTFTFRGKSGKDHCIELSDRRLARIVRACKDIPGYELFQFYDDSGRRQPITSTDVNGYLRETTGQDFTAKDFRTWGGSVLAAVTLYEMGSAETEKEAAGSVTRMVTQVAEQLGNTVAVCRKYYIHPALYDAYLDGNLPAEWDRALRQPAFPQLDPEESALLHFLERNV